MSFAVTDFQRLSLEVNGFRFDGLVKGPESAELVLFLHGFPEFAVAWAEIMRFVAEAGYRTVAVDQRGYSPGARPPRVADYATDRLVSDALGFADRLGGRRFHLVAHDWGGLLAWKLAAEHPERLRSLNVVATPHNDAFLEARATDRDQKRRSRYIDFFRLPCHLAERVLLWNDAKLLRKAYQGKVPQDLVEYNVRRLASPGALTPPLNWYRALDLHARVGKVTVPTLYVWGSEDQWLRATAAKATGNYVSGSYRFEVLQGASHWMLEEKPAVIAGLLLDHFGALGGKAARADANSV